MKTSIPRQLLVLCIFVFSILCGFQVGALYAAKPYRALAASAPNGLEFSQIAVQQSRTLMIVSFAALGVSLLGFGLMLVARFRKNEPNQSSQPLRASGPLG